MSEGQRFRLRDTSSGDEVILEAKPDTVYVDERTGEPMEVVGEVLPLAPSDSKLPWAVENLRFCNWCESMVMESPSRMKAMLPPAAASGAT